MKSENIEDINKKLRKNDYNTDNKYGDYILVSDNMSINLYVPIDFDRDAVNNPTSDHLPVVGDIKLNSKHEIPQQSSEEGEGEFKNPINVSVNDVYDPPNYENEEKGEELEDFEQNTEQTPKSTKSRTLRLINSVEDPETNKKIDKFKFKGEYVEDSDKLIYPSGDIIKDDGNEFVCVITGDNKYIGYVKPKYLENVDISEDGNSVQPNTYKLKETITFRLKPQNRFTKDIKGPTICENNKVYIPNGEVIKNTDLVVVQVKNKPEKIGFIHKKKLKLDNSYCIKVTYE